MEETTHDSSSSSRKNEEKRPPAGGIKIKIGGFKTGHCYHKPSDAAIQQEPNGVSSGVWLPRLSQDDFDRVVQTTPSGFLACFHDVIYIFLKKHCSKMFFKCFQDGTF